MVIVNILFSSVSVLRKSIGRVLFFFLTFKDNSKFLDVKYRVGYRIYFLFYLFRIYLEYRIYFYKIGRYI